MENNQRIIRLKKEDLGKKINDDVELLFLENIDLHDNFGNIKNLSNIELPFNLKYFLILEDNSPKKNITIRRTQKNLRNFFKDYAKSIIDKFKIPFNCKVLLFGVYQFNKSLYTCRYTESDIYKNSEEIEVIKCTGYEPDEISFKIVNLDIPHDCKGKLMKNYCENIRSGYELYKTLNQTLLSVIIYTEIKELVEIIENNIKE